MDPIKVFVYKNLHKNQFSVKALEGPMKGLVVAHRNYVVLTDVQGKVSQAGRARVLKEKCKNVHAGLVGYWADQDMDIHDLVEEKVDSFITYNPYLYDSFVYKESPETSFTGSQLALMSTDEFTTDIKVSLN